MSKAQTAEETTLSLGFWRSRYTLICLCALATFICYLDRINISVTIIPMAEEMSWDPKTQGLVLSSFFVGYLLTQIIGGWLADKFGGKIVLAYGVMLWSLFTVLIPPSAAFGLTMLILVRIGLGMGEAVLLPSIYALVGRWFPATERARAISFNTSFVWLGTVCALLVTPVIVSSLGWRWVFYLYGALGVFWFLLWLPLVSAQPQSHRKISAQELAEISGSSQPAGADNAPGIVDLLKHRAVWAIIVAHFCYNWSLYVLLSWLPSFVNKGLGVDFKSVGLVTMLPYVCAFFAMNVAGTVADKLVTRGMSVTRVRKLMQTLAMGGLVISLSIVGLVETVTAAIIIMCCGMGLGSFAGGGFAVNHMDIAPRHAGKLMGITNTAGTIPGIVGVYISGLILQLTGSWMLVFQVTAGVSLFGLIFYLLFASGEKIYD